MASKLFIRLIKPRAPIWCMMLQKSRGPEMNPRRTILGLVPPTQYDTRWSKKFSIGYLMSSAGYEILPVVCITSAAMAWLVFSVCNAVKNKVSLFL